MNILPRFLNGSSDDGSSSLTIDPEQAKLERELILREAEIGGRLFGAVPKGHRRYFFCLDEHTWIWHEEWTEKGQRQVLTTRYEARPDGVLKIQGRRPYERLSKDEARNLLTAAQLYVQHVGEEYRRLLPVA